MKAQEIDEFKTKIQKETMETVLKTIKVQDTFFYAEMVIMKASPVEDPFQQKIKAIIKMKLYNSKEFQMPNMVNDNKKYLTAKEIRSEVVLDSYDLISSKEDAMLLVYKEVGAQIAADLFQENARNIDMVVNDRRNFI